MKAMNGIRFPERRSIFEDHGAHNVTLLATIIEKLANIKDNIEICGPVPEPFHGLGMACDRARAPTWN
jgi:hypothetical protein